MNTEQSNKLRNTQRQETRVTRFYRSFSGTDALVFAILPQTEPVLIGSISTLSYSMYRDKKPVPVIGKVNMGGYTRGVRLYAGTMIFTLINQHWINELKDAITWIDRVGVQKIDELPLMDLMVVCANEYGAAMQMMLYGVEVTEEGQVISIENLFTENTFSFVARDLSNFSNNVLDGKGNIDKIEPMVKYNQFGITQLQTRLTPTYTETSYESEHRHDFTSRYLVASDEIKQVQEKLNHVSSMEDQIPLTVNGWFDGYTFEAVKEFQSRVGLPVTGELDDKTYQCLTELADGDDKIELSKVKTAVVSCIEGAVVKVSPTFDSETIYVYPPMEQLNVLAEKDQWALTHRGYVHKDLLHFDGDTPQSFTNDMRIELLTPADSFKIPYEQLIRTSNDYGVTIESETALELRIGTVAKYPDGEFKVESFTKQISAGKAETVRLSDYADCLMYQVKRQSTPTKLEFVIHTSNQTTYKWSFEIEKGVQYVTT